MSQEQDNLHSNLAIAKRVDHVLCRTGLLLLEGTLEVTSNEISFLNPTPSKDRIEVEGKDNEDSDSGKDTPKRNESSSITIPLNSIESMTYDYLIGIPSLIIKWRDETRSFGKVRKTQFLQKSNSPEPEKRMASLIPAIDFGRAQKVSPPKEETVSEAASPPLQDTAELEKEILKVLDPKDWKGPFQIVTELRDRYESKNFDFDLIEDVCKKMAQKKLIEADKEQEFFRKIKS